MKRIILCVTTDLSYDQRMQRIAQSLHKAGYDVTLVGRKKTDSIALAATDYKQVRLNCWTQKGKFFYVEYNLRLFFYLLFKSFEAVCAIDLDTILPCYYVTKLKGKPCVYDAHEYFTEVPEVVTRPKIKRFWEWVARHTIAKMSACYTVGAGLADIFTQTYQKPFGVVRNVPLRRLYTPRATPATPPYIIQYQGALNDGRGLPEAIMAMKQVPNAVLMIAGEGDLSAALRELVARENLQEQVKFLGYVQPKDLKALTQEAYIGINLLENKGLNYYYSLANKCFDYLQARVPALNMNFPEYLALHKTYHADILIEHLDADIIAAALNQLIQDKDLYAQLQANCALAAERLTWEAEELVLLDIWKQVLGAA